MSDTSDPMGEAVTLVIFAVVVLLSGAVVRRQRDKAEEMRLQRDRADARAREIATTERARIARELHDVVAHVRALQEKVHVAMYQAKRACAGVAV